MAEKDREKINRKFKKLREKRIAELTENWQKAIADLRKSLETKQSNINIILLSILIGISVNFFVSSIFYLQGV
jgi:hypothetical protein